MGCAGITGELGKAQWSRSRNLARRRARADRLGFHSGQSARRAVAVELEGRPASTGPNRDCGMIARRSKGPVAHRPAGASSLPPSRPMLDDAAFEAFLHKRRPHPPVFSMSGLDGYLTALIIGPRFIDPRQWIGLFAGERALMALGGTTEALAVQTLVANYNRISTGLAETPEIWRPRFARRKDGTFDA